MMMVSVPPKNSTSSERPQNLTILSEMRNTQKSNIALYTGGSYFSLVNSLNISNGIIDTGNVA
jgi:hypothetical protein